MEIGGKKEAGQSTVEYLLITVALVVFFGAMFGFLQGQLASLFKSAGIRILTAYF